jgi:hypothetical protein
MKTNKRKSKHEKRAKHTFGESERDGRLRAREREANDIIFIFVNEFRTRKKLLTSAGLYFSVLFLDVDNQICCLRAMGGAAAEE